MNYIKQDGSLFGQLLFKMKSVILFLFIGSVFTGVVNADSVWDEIIDQAIDAARGDIIDKHLDLIHIPDIDQEFHETVFGIPFSVVVKTNGAEFWNVSTVSRRGPVTVLQDDVSGNITISTALGLDDFYASCKSLYLHVFGLTVSGSLSTHCASNTLEFSLSLITDKQDNCKAYINWARVTNFNKFSVDIKPAGVLNWLAEHIVSFILNDFSSKVTLLINEDLPVLLNTAISKVDVCSYVPI